MDAKVVGSDVSKDRLDVAVRPTGESFVFKRTGVGIEDLIVRLEALSPKMVAIWSSIPRRCAPSPRRSANEPRPTQLMRL